jgi:hypothetical protein
VQPPHYSKATANDKGQVATSMQIHVVTCGSRHPDAAMGAPVLLKIRFSRRPFKARGIRQTVEGRAASRVRLCRQRGLRLHIPDVRSGFCHWLCGIRRLAPRFSSGRGNSYCAVIPGTTPTHGTQLAEESCAYPSFDDPRVWKGHSSIIHEIMTRDEPGAIVTSVAGRSPLRIAGGHARGRLDRRPHPGRRDRGSSFLCRGCSGRSAGDSRSHHLGRNYAGRSESGCKSAGMDREASDHALAGHRS